MCVRSLTDVLQTRMHQQQKNFSVLLVIVLRYSATHTISIYLHSVCLLILRRLLVTPEAAPSHTGSCSLQPERPTEAARR